MKTPAAPLLTLLALTAAACSSSGPRVAEITPEPPAAVQAPPVEPAPDPVQELLDRADRLFEQGRSELVLGHLAQAKEAFNASLEVLLESPQGVRSNPRVREHFEKLVDRIATLELTSLAAGDGFTEQRAEPAPIDRLIDISIFDTAPPAPETAQNVEADLAETEHDLPIPLNERVLRFVELFQGRLREFLQEGLQRGAQYLPMIQSVFRAEGLPLDLAYVPLVESAFKPTAVSRARARGVWQFMRGTGLENGLRQDWYVDERSDPEKATVAAARYFKQLYEMFGDWHLALASYNGGPGRVQRALRRSGRRDFWSLSASSRYLPRETRNYVPMILAAAIIAKNPVKYGFEAVDPAPPAIETVEVPPVDLRRIAEWAGVPVDEIQRLNPELRRWTTPIRDTYTLNVPEGTADLIRGQLALADPATLNALQWHVVKRGETLAAIARKLRVRRVDLAEANFLPLNARLQPGQKLLIPRMPSAAVLARVAAGEPINVASAEGVFEDPPVDEEIVYRVKRGDTLSEIARRYGTTVAALKRANRLRGNLLRVGQRLVIETGAATASQQE